MKQMRVCFICFGGAWLILAGHLRACDRAHLVRRLESAWVVFSAFASIHCVQRLLLFSRIAHSQLLLPRCGSVVGSVGLLLLSNSVY